MKTPFFDKNSTILVLFSLSIFLAASPAKGPQTFIGSTPCNPELRQMLNIPDSSKAEFVTWKLLLIPHGSAQPTYKLEYVYGLSKPGTRGFMGGGTKAALTGTWKFEDAGSVLPGSALPGGVLPGSVPPGRTLPGKYLIRLMVAGKDMTFVSLDPHTMHLLDSEGHLMVGNAAWSYTLTEQPK